MLGTFFTRGPPPALRARVFSGLNGSLGFLCSPPAAFGSHVGSLCSNLLCSRGGGRRAGPFGLELYARRLRLACWLALLELYARSLSSHVLAAILGSN
jgi:hypothetical protein